MAYLIAVVSQKGGVGKSTITRLLAAEFAAAQWDVKVADMDAQQGTLVAWHGRRIAAEIQPEIDVQRYTRVDRAIEDAEKYDAMIFDGAPHATKQTAEIAKVADLVIIPTGVTEDDREPGLILAKDLVRAGVPKERISFAFCRVPKAQGLLSDAYYYFVDREWNVLSGAVPEQAGYAEAHNEGKAISETRFASLNKQAKELAQQAIDMLSEQQEERVA